MDTFDKEKAERRKARQAKIDAQMKAMENAMGAADASYRNFMVNNLEDAEASQTSDPDLVGSFRVPRASTVASPSTSSRGASRHARRGSGNTQNSVGDSSVSVASEDSMNSNTTERRNQAIDLARSFLNDEDGGYSSRSILSDPEFAHADASGRSIHNSGIPGAIQSASQSANTLMGQAATSLRNVVGGVGGNDNDDEAVESVNTLMGRAGESLKRAVGGVGGRRAHHHQDADFNSSDKSFRADNLHNLSAGLDNYSDPHAHQPKRSNNNSFSSRTKDDRRTAHLRDDDDALDDAGILERLEWSCIRLSNKVETLCFHRRCLLLMAATTTIIAIIVAILTTTSSFNGRLPHLNIGGESVEELEAESERYVKVRDRILFAEASEPASLESKGNTPQSFALMWIARHDPMQLDPDDPYLLQRYALAVVWFQLRTDDKGEPTVDMEWKDESNWMSEMGYCSWYGVKCHPQDGMPKDATQYDGNNIILGLNLTKNGLRGDEMPKEICTSLEGLQTLDISHNKLGGSIPTEIKRLTALEGLYIGDNVFSGRLVSEIGQLTYLMNLYAQNNTLTGHIPEEIGNLVNLYALGLHENELSGTIPSSFGKCTKLRNLYLDENQIGGSIPENIYSLTHLADLRLRSNKLTGPISENISNLRSLELLYLDGNSLTSTSEYMYI